MLAGLFCVVGLGAVTLDKQLTEEELVRWVENQRGYVEQYLTKQGIENPTVGEWPAWEAAPYFAIWAVESKSHPGSVGWWAFSGDCPTDYVSASGERHPRHALEMLIDAWRSYVPFMKVGKQPPGMYFGDESGLPAMGELLKSRVSILTEWLADDEEWADL